MKLVFSIAVVCLASYYDPGSDGLDPLGKKKDVFDEVTKQKRRPAMDQKQPDCPAPDGLSPFSSLAFVDGKIYVRRELNDTTAVCEDLIQIGQSNVTELMKAAKACGPIGEVKRRIAQNLFAVFWSGGLDGWPTGEDKTIFVKTDRFEGEVEISAEKFERLEACWMEGCGCEQARSPLMRVVFALLFAVCLGGLGYDSLSLLKGKEKKKRKERDPAKKKERKEKKEKKERKDDFKGNKERDGDADNNDKDDASAPESSKAESQRDEPTNTKKTKK